ncbi:vomeronasal type-1 receptor 4-like [Panthera leo]|uniref:vomeronasal type-1 receptor 4-like n=1 Tax=Panthera leo TaxID=9689 RepID=UPI001C6A50DE|nr:vomeronasal type-1 receptor 4-like [Panthera leo]
MLLLIVASPSYDHLVLSAEFSMEYTGKFLHLLLSLGVFGNLTGPRKLLLVSDSSMSLFAQKNDCYYYLEENVLNDRMAPRDLAIAVIFLSQTIVGILGNFSLLHHYVFHYHTEGSLRPTELILMHLLIANSLTMLSKGVPQTLAAFGLQYFLNEFGCELLLYVQRVGRGMSIGSTCLLSVFQTVTISPMNSCWKDLKTKAPKYIGLSISLCWIQFMFVNLIFPMYVLYASNNWHMKNITKKRDLGYCLSVDTETITVSVYAALIVFPEVSLSGLTIWTSGSMVFLLHRHKQRVQHIHSTNVAPRSSAESRATQSILVLMSTFVSFHFLSSVFHACIALSYNPSRWLVKTTAVISVGFPAISPFLLMRQDSTVRRLCFSWIRNTKSPNLTRRNVNCMCLSNAQLFIYSSCWKSQYRT